MWDRSPSDRRLLGAVSRRGFLRGLRAEGAAPALWLNDVRGGLVDSGIAPDGAGTFLRVSGASTERVTNAGHATWSPEASIAPEKSVRRAS